MVYFQASYWNETITTVDILSQAIFLNSNIKYNGRPLFIKQFIKSNLFCLCDIIQDKQLCNITDIKRIIIKYPGALFDLNSVNNALLNIWKSKLSEIKDEELYQAKRIIENIPDVAVQLFKKKNKDIRNLLITTKNNSPCSQIFWKRKLILILVLIMP